MSRRVVGVPWLFAVAAAAIGFSVYFALGVVADRGLGLTPVIFAVAGIVFVLTTFTYVEGGAMYRERGGSTTLARHAFNELVSFVAGWAILIDYVLIIALAAISVPHYLAPLSEEIGGGVAEVPIGIAVVLAAAAINIAGSTGRRRPGLLLGIAIADNALQIAIIMIGAIALWDPSALTAELDLFSSPGVGDIAFAVVVSMIALAGIEAASDLAPDLDWSPEDLRAVVRAGAIAVPLIYIGMAAIALMALPVIAGPSGPETALATQFQEAPILAVAERLEPDWVGMAMKWAVVAIAPLVLLFAATMMMLGLSRHVYVLAVNRQVPSWLGKLGRRRSTPYVAISIAAVAAIGLLIPADIELLAGIFAFGAMLAISIAHLSLIKLRFSEPDRERPYRVPFNIRVRGTPVPIPTILGGLMSLGVLGCVIALHGRALFVGAGWILLGLVGYVVHRRGVSGISLTEHVSVPESALFKVRPNIELESILVPIFGHPRDDQIVSIGGRLADSKPAPGQARPRLDILYVLELPLTIPLDGPLPADRLAAADRAIARATEIAAEYPSVAAAGQVVASRSSGETIVAEAKARQVQAIVLGGEPPSRIRGGAILGGVRASRIPELGPVTEYVLRHAPCRVLLTAPPDDNRGPGEE